MQQKIELNLDLVNAILTYLGTKPFVEVSQLINAVQQQAQGQITAPVEAEVIESATVN